MSKKKIFTGGLVYSTHQDVLHEVLEEDQETLAPEKQILRIRLDTKQRAGKVVTVIEGFVGTLVDLEQLGKTVKTKCGTGGSVKHGQILIQGDYKKRVTEILTQLRYKIKP
jgi:translation initiation factor 1